MARIIQDRQRSLAEHTLPDSQCGFRSGRGCIDNYGVCCQAVNGDIHRA